ncbi:MAG: UDP-N-acetylmuramate--L-alanine ligase [Clostridiaceae bacterium]|nr:UDP-N-acetylmuramate--L-alanine ligase [Eubacteriales bacterium]
MTHIGDHKRIHLIGIGGCSMSGLAQILTSRGYGVQGSDAVTSPFTERLMELGIPVSIGHGEKNVEGADLVIYSAAIKPDNVERAYARAHNIPELERSVALGQLSEHYKQVVGIAGCHGKTTVTSMLALVSDSGALDATVHVGGFVEFLRGGVRLSDSDLFITEACEYVESFLTLRPTVALINNIDDDHLDYYRDIEHITEAFRKFLALLPKDGLFIGCTDDVRVRKLLDAYAGKKLSYGLRDADYTPADVRYDELGCPSYTLTYREKAIGRLELHVPGEHIVVDSMAAAVTALALSTPFPAIAAALSRFQNTRRRFEYYGERNGVKVFHDYAHHPSEISAVMDAASRYPHKRLWCVFQCNSYTRAKTLFLGPLLCFKHADAVLVPDIYPGREKDDGTVHARDMVNAIEKSGTKAVYLSTFEEIRAWLDENAGEGDVVVTLGSGDVYKQTRKLL